MSRTSVISSVAAIVSYTGRWVDYKYGETILLAPISMLIPRFLWPSKPNVAIGREFGVTFDLVPVGDAHTQIAPTVIGEFYWNFHIPGVIVGMFLMGAAYRWLYLRYGEIRGYQPIRTATYLMLLTVALQFEGNVAILVGVVTKTIFLLWAMIFVLRRAGAVVDVPEEATPSAASFSP